MARVLIRDGYTVEDKFRSKLFNLPEVVFKYRPALPEKVFDFMMARKETGRDQLRHIAEMLKYHLVSWDIEDDVEEQVLNPDTGVQEKVKRVDVVPISIDNLKRVPKPILEYIVDAVCGYTPAKAEADEKN